VIRRRVAVLLVAFFGVVGLLLAPSPSGAGHQSNTKGNGPKETRCDPQPTRGNGPPPGHGTKNCASP
jgi:hypothetical protein